MRPLQVSVLLVLPIAAFGVPHQVALPCLNKHPTIRPAWEKENNDLIVPLTDQARKGNVDPVVEEGLITLGTLPLSSLSCSLQD